MISRFLGIVFLIGCGLFSSSASADNSHFSTLKRAYHKHLQRLKFSEKIEVDFKFDENASDLQNLDRYGRALLAEYTKLEHAYWLNAALVYRAFCSVPSTTLWCQIGQGYQAVALAGEKGDYLDINTLSVIDVSPEREAFYLFYAQNCSLVLRMLEKEFFLKLRGYLSFPKFLKHLEADTLMGVLYLHKNLDLQEWYEQHFDKRVAGLYSIMPTDYVARQFKRLFTIEFIREDETGVTGRQLEDIKTLVAFRVDRRVAQNIGSVYYILAQRLWFVSPPLLRPAVEELANSYVELKAGRIGQFTARRKQSLNMFSNALKRADSISGWLSNVEVAVTAPEVTLKPFLDIVDSAEVSELSRYLNDIEAQLDALKE